LVAGLDDTSIPEFGPVGTNASSGIVPSPEQYEPPSGIADEYLQEDATWGFPFRGLVGVTTDGDTDPTDKLEVLGGLHVSADLSTDEIVVRKVTVLGTLLLPGVLATSEDELSVAGLL